MFSGRGSGAALPASADEHRDDEEREAREGGEQAGVGAHARGLTRAAAFHGRRHVFRIRLVVLAAARPQTEGKSVTRRKGMDLVIAIDVSKSMLVGDVEVGQPRGG